MVNARITCIQSSWCTDLCFLNHSNLLAVHTDSRIVSACELLREGFQDGNIHFYCTWDRQHWPSLFPYFQDLTMFCTTDGNDSLRMPMHTAVVQATLVGGEMWIALSEADDVESGVKKGQVVGAASWYPPGSDFLAEYGLIQFWQHVEADLSINPHSDAQVNAGYSQLLENLQKTHQALHNWWISYLIPKLERTSAECYGTPEDPKGEQFKKQNYGLVSFAVKPSLQGRGIGKKLLAIGEERVRLSLVSFQDLLVNPWIGSQWRIESMAWNGERRTSAFLGWTRRMTKKTDALFRSPCILTWVTRRWRQSLYMGSEVCLVIMRG